MKRAVFAMMGAALLAAPTPIHAEQTSGKKRRPLPHEFGRVVLDNESTKAGVPPVVFDHWLHRAKYTCRRGRNRAQSHCQRIRPRPARDARTRQGRKKAKAAPVTAPLRRCHPDITRLDPTQREDP